MRDPKRVTRLATLLVIYMCAAAAPHAVGQPFNDLCTKISVYEGSCDALGCVTGLDDTPGCGGFTTTLKWPSEAGSEYLTLVHGFGSATGDFDLTVTCGDRAANDDCEDSVGPLAVDSVTSGSTTDATFDGAPFCGTSNTAPGVWYTVTGTGNTMTASTCNDGDPSTGGANYDTKISVYCADCENPECIGGQDDNFPAGCAGFSTKFSWPIAAGATYNVLVHGLSNQTGDFELAILDDGVPVEGGNDCDGVPEEFDVCPGTSVPEPVSTSGTLAANKSALTGTSGVFETAPPNPQGLLFTTEDTAGCSCEQIVDALHLGEGHLINGCSPGAMQNWVRLLEEASCGNCVEPHGGRHLFSGREPAAIGGAGPGSSPRGAAPLEGGKMPGQAVEHAGGAMRPAASQRGGSVHRRRRLRL